MTNYPDREELARELYIKDNHRHGRAKALADWHDLKVLYGDETYVHVLADAALELFKAANPKPKKAKGGKITGFGPSPAGNIQVVLSPGGPSALRGMPDIPAQILAHINQRNVL